LYESEVEFTESLAMDLYEISDKYLQSELADACEEYLSKHLKLDNLGAMIEFTEKFGTDLLRDAIVEFIGKNLQEIRKNHVDYVIPSIYLLDMASKFQEKLQVTEKKPGNFGR